MLRCALGVLGTPFGYRPAHCVIKLDVVLLVGWSDRGAAHWSTAWHQADDWQVVRQGLETHTDT